MFEARVLADSVAPNGARLTTIMATFPKFILAEVNTHKMLSKVSASSRAIPISKRIQEVLDNPVIPVSLGRNRPGMQAGEELDQETRIDAINAWLEGRDLAVETARRLAKLGVHKQITNRVLEPWLWNTAIITGTDWDNMFALRCNPAAQPEFQAVAVIMLDAMQTSRPRLMEIGDWHLPFYDAELDHDIPRGRLPWVCAARCARVSYNRHDGERDPEADFELASKLRHAGHMSPFECVAFANSERGYVGNLDGWTQLRKTIIGERIHGDLNS